MGGLNLTLKKKDMKSQELSKSFDEKHSILMAKIDAEKKVIDQEISELKKAILIAQTIKIKTA